MNNQDWEDVDVPRGAFISWGNAIGQYVTGKVLSYDERGGTDFAGEVCPQVQVELIEATYSINKEGQRTNHSAGEIVIMNCGPVSLKRAVRAAALDPGDLVKITLESLAKTNNGTVKEFGIKVARGAGVGMSSPAAQPAPAPPQTPVPTAPAAAPAAAPTQSPAQLAKELLSQGLDISDVVAATGLPMATVAALRNTITVNA